MCSGVVAHTFGSISHATGTTSNSDGILLDSTQIRLDEVERNALLGHGSPVTDALALLYHQWIDAYQPWSSNMPSLFDVVPVAWLIDPKVCTTTALHIVVTDDGRTVAQQRVALHFVEADLGGIHRHHHDRYA